VIFGPVAAIAAYQQMPEVFTAAIRMAKALGLDPLVGWMAACAPWMVLAGIPVWWLGGAVALWFEKRRGKDIAELAADARDNVKELAP